MQSINIYLSKTEIGYYLPDSTSNWRGINLTAAPSGSKDDITVFDGLKNLLSQIDHLELYKINIIPDQHYILYSYLKLPLISKRKISNILQHELGNHLINDLSEYRYDYIIKIDKEQSCIECGVYFIKKDLIESILAIAKAYSVELAGIYPLNHLISQNYIDEHQIQNDSRIYVYLIEKYAKLFVYHKGFLSGYATIFCKSSNIDDLINIINQKITAIVLHENQIEFTRVDSSHPDILSENNDSDIVYPTDPPLTFDQLPPTDYRLFNQCFQPGALPKFNLLKSNIMIFKELKKYSKRLIVTASLFFICLMLYLTNIGFNIYSGKQVNGQLEAKYTQLINKYLPKGTSKINAVYVLKQRITEYEDQQEAVQKYSERKYETITFINDISQMKSKITSLTVKRLSFGQNSISIMGKVENISDYDLLQEIFTTKYPEDHYRLKMDQKSQGNESILFTTTIRPI
ncbi:MAG: hypothetical protein HOC24_07675 [Deltaproteobacteria bacterium]|jgi:hypothetical protein|nr:hypothetical protein [Deltaproteobacteria bacterium]